MQHRWLLSFFVKLRHALIYPAMALLVLISWNLKPTFAQSKSESLDSRTIVVEAIKAIKKLAFVSYDASFEAVYPDSKKMLSRGQVEIKRGGVSNEVLPGKIYIKSEGVAGALEISFDGRIAGRLEHDKKLLTEGIADKGGISVVMTPALTLLQWNFIWDEPMKFESAATAAEYVGRATVEGVSCHVLDLKYSVPGTDISGGRWWFAVDDKLPRMHQTTENASNGKIVRKLLITNLRTGNGIPEWKFKLELPEGYAYRTFSSSGANVKLIPVGQTAPDWTLRDKAGRNHRLSDYRGKVVVLEFWASWCGYCKLSIPAMQKMHEKFSENDVKVLAVNFQELEDVDADAYLKSKGAAYLTVLNGEKIAKAYGVTSVPVFLVVNREGETVYASREYYPGIERRLEEAVRQALGETPQK